MKKSAFFAVLLVVAAAFIFTSCDGLTNPGNQTGSFSFKISDEMIAAISRTAASGNTTCTITLHLYSADGTSYNQTKTKTDKLAALKGYTFDPFTNIPFDMEMNLTVEVTAGGEPVYTSDIEPFSLSASESSKTLHIHMNRVKPAQNTPFILTAQIEEDNVFVPKFLLLPADTAFEAETTRLTELPGAKQVEIGSISDNEFYCCDANGTMWYVDYPEEDYLLRVTDITGITKTVTITTDTEMFGIDGITYDPVYDRLYMICDIWTQSGEEDGYETYYMKSFEPEEYLTWGETLFLKKQDLTQLSADSYNLFGGIIYAYNGFLYTLHSNDSDMQFTKEAAIAPITKISLSDGKLVKEGTVSIPRANPLEGATFENGEISNDNYLNGYGGDTSYDSFRFVFNDMAVYDDSIYIPVSQKEIWADDYNQPNNEEVTFPGTPNGGYVRRGGIIVLDAETLEQKGTLGMSPVQESLELPLAAHITWRKEGTYGTLSADTVLYKDREYSEPFTYNIPISFAMPEWNKNAIVFTNPLKIVAVKPKKLVVLDQGWFYWIDDDKDENGKPVVKEHNSDQNQYFQLEPAIRLITVDLENFANSKVTTSFTDETEELSYNHNIDTYTQNGSNYPSAIKYTTGMSRTPGTVYYPALDFTATQYTPQAGGTAYRVEEFHQTGEIKEYDDSTGSDFRFNTDIALPF